MLLLILLVVLILIVGAVKAVTTIGLAIAIVLGAVVGAVALFFAGCALIDLCVLIHRHLIARKKRLEEAVLDAGQQILEDADKEDDD